MIPYGKHFIDDADISSVVEVLRKGWLTQGPKVAEFEKAVAKFTGAKYAVAVSSGTAGLHIACLAANIGQESVVYTSSNTFVASANAVLYAGGKPHFCDIEPKTLNLSPDYLEKKLQNDSRLDCIIPVHFAGLPCDMKRIKSIADNKRAKIIEDASHAFGATYSNGNKVGNCSYSDMTVFSFHPVKGITSGEGGIVTTNDYDIYRKLLLLRSHGITKGDSKMQSGVHKDDVSFFFSEDASHENKINPWYYEMQELGFNYRLTDFQCALVLSQMKKTEMFLKRRKAIALIYDDLFKDNEHIIVKQKHNRLESSLHLYVIEIDFSSIGTSRGNFMRELAKKNIGTQVHYIPVPFHPYYANLGHKREDFPISKEYYDKALSIPMYYSLSDDEVFYVATEIKKLVAT